MLYVLTLALDAAPFLVHHLHALDGLTIPWKWIVVEGVAAPVKDTSWCRAMPGRISEDGSHQMLRQMAQRHPNVVHLYRPLWQGKVEMVNAGLAHATKPGVLLQIDADELYTTKQLDTLYVLLWPYRNTLARFRCRYRVGVNIQTVGDNCYGNRNGEWLRAWTYLPGMRFTSHEPPVLDGDASRKEIGLDVTTKLGLTFDHWTWTFESQVAYKTKFYGYRGGLEGWRRLQENKKWPYRLGNFLPWVTDDTQADLIHRE